MRKRVAIVDYGIGNVCSVRRALEKFDAEVFLADTPDAIESAPALVLPGVGAFAHGMEELRGRGLVEPLRAYAGNGRPLLGICLGMQLLLSHSSEFGEYEGLGVIPGRVDAIRPHDSDGSPLKIPHIGWSRLERPGNGRQWAGSLLDGSEEGARMYFVHSFAVHPSEDETRLADVIYGGQRFSAVIAQGNVVGCQFHPEKSGPAGLRVIQNFVQRA